MYFHDMPDDSGLPEFEEWFEQTRHLRPLPLFADLPERLTPVPVLTPDLPHPDDTIH